MLPMEPMPIIPSLTVSIRGDPRLKLGPMTNDKSQMTNFIPPPGRSTNCQSVPAAAGSFRRAERRHQPTDPGFHRLGASTWFDPGAYCNRTPRDTAKTGEYMGSFGEWGIQTLWRVHSGGSTRLPWSIHYPWNTRSSGRNSRDQICRKGRGTGEENPSSDFRLPPDVQSQARRKDRKGEPQFFSSGHRFSVVWHNPDKKGSDDTLTGRTADANKT
jgi:hypothetical protein